MGTSVNDCDNLGRGMISTSVDAAVGNYQTRRSITLCSRQVRPVLFCFSALHTPRVVEIEEAFPFARPSKLKIATST